MGNSCCLEPRDKVLIYSESKYHLPGPYKEEKLLLQANKQPVKPIKIVKINKNSLVTHNKSHEQNESLKIVKESEASEKEKSSSQLLNRIKNITSYKPKQSKPILNLAPYQMNSKLAYSSFTCDKTPSNNPSKVDENRSLKLQDKEISNIKTAKSTNQLINYVTLNCWKIIADYLNKKELTEFRRCCLFFNGLASSPLILKKFFMNQTPKAQGTSDQQNSLKTSKTEFRFDFSNITNLIKRRSNLKEETASKTNYTKSNSYSRKGSQCLEIIQSVQDSNVTPFENHKPSLNERHNEDIESSEIKLHISKADESQIHDSNIIVGNHSTSSNNKSKLLSINSKLVDSLIRNSAGKFSGSISDISCGTSQQLSISNRTDVQLDNANCTSSTNLICMLTPISIMSPTNLSRAEAKSSNDDSSFNIAKACEATNNDKG